MIFGLCLTKTDFMKYNSWFAKHTVDYTENTIRGNFVTL